MNRNNSTNVIPIYRKLWFKFSALLAFLALFFGVLSDGLNVFDRLKENKIDKKNSLPQGSPITNKAVLKKYYVTADATNTTASETSGADMIITQVTDNRFSCKGKFDGNKLYGRFDTNGEIISANNDQLKINFKGQILFGSDGSGFLSGSKTTFEFFVELDTISFTGIANYIIDEIPRSSWDNTKQYGQLSMAIQSIEIL